MPGRAPAFPSEGFDAVLVPLVITVHETVVEFVLHHVTDGTLQHIRVNEHDAVIVPPAVRQELVHVVGRDIQPRTVITRFDGRPVMVAHIPVAVDEGGGLAVLGAELQQHVAVVGFRCGVYARGVDSKNDREIVRCQLRLQVPAENEE